MSDELDKDFDFTDEDAVQKWAKEFLEARDAYLSTINDEDFELNRVQYNKLLELIELFEKIAKRETAPADVELHNGVNVEIFPVSLQPKKQCAFFEVEFDSCELNEREVEVCKRAIENGGSLEIAQKTYGKTRLVFRIPDVYTPKEQ